MMHGVVSIGSRLVQSLSTASTRQPIRYDTNLQDQATKCPGHNVTCHISSKNVISSDGQVAEFKLGEAYHVAHVQGYHLSHSYSIWHGTDYQIGLRLSV